MLSAQGVLLILSLIVLVFGVVSVGLARSAHPQRAAWGRRLSFAVLLALGGKGVLAACICAKGLPYLGILAGLLVVAMVWETPSPTFDQHAS